MSRQGGMSDRAGWVVAMSAMMFAGAVARSDEPGPGAKPAILRGRVVDESGAPLADVRVRVAIPATDMRFLGTDVTSVVREGFPKPREIREVRTDAGGVYRMEIPGLKGSETVSIDASKPGYRRLVGTLMQGGDARRVKLRPGADVAADLALKPSSFVTGVVVDDRGRPIPGVEISARALFNRASGGVEVTRSRGDGTFELFNYPQKADGFGVGTVKGRIFFQHPDHIDTRIDDLYSLAPEARQKPRVVLPIGCKLAGTVVDADGKPVAGATVRFTRKDDSHSKTVLSDAQGRFVVRGLSPGLTRIWARSMAIHQRGEMPIALKGDREGLQLRLKPMGLPADPGTVEVLGMKLADVTPALKDAYDLFNDRGALILDTGRDFHRLAIGQISEGDVFWMVGQKRIGSVREFVDRLLAEVVGPKSEGGQVRIVYTFYRPDAMGTNTQGMKITKADVEQLRRLADRLNPDGPR